MSLTCDLDRDGDAELLDQLLHTPRRYAQQVAVATT